MSRKESQRRPAFLGRIFVIGAAILAVGFLAVPFAKGKGFDDLINALNVLIGAEGPFPGIIAEDIPEAEANDQMSDVGFALSDGQTNSQNPQSAGQFAV